MKTYSEVQKEFEALGYNPDLSAPYFANLAFKVARGERVLKNESHLERSTIADVKRIAQKEGKNMEIKTENMCSNEIRKIGLIIGKLSELGWNVSGYGFSGVNPNSGNTYIWLEDYPVTPYIGLCGDDVCFLSSCPECGEEWDIDEADVKAENWPTECEACGKSI